MAQPKVVKLISFILLIFSFQISQAQDQIIKNLQETARTYLNNGNYKAAFDAYEKLLALDSRNAVYNYEMGVCVFKGSVDKTKAIPYFEVAQENVGGKAPDELYYYLGKSYHYQGNFDFAIPAYSTAIYFLSGGKAGAELKAELLELIDQCERGKLLVKGQDLVVLTEDNGGNDDVYKYFVDGNRYVKIENLGNIVNSDYSEYGPLFINNNNTLLFTSRRKGTGGQMYYDDQYYEDIYVANYNNGKLSEVINLNQSDLFGSALKNTAKHDATVSVSAMEDILYIYYRNHVMELVKSEDGTWLAPVELTSDVANAANSVTSATLSSSGKLLLMVSNRPNDTKGGRDIYYSEKLENGNWGPMTNMGEPINTISDESSPFMPNDSTLYFSSKGHSSIGGYDVFVSHKRNGKWQTPEDLNMPINTPYDEINYRVSSDRKFAYYASDRNEGYGKFDIYKITKGFDVIVDETLLATFDGVEEDSLPSKTFLDESALQYENDKSIAKNESSEKLIKQEGGAEIKGNEQNVLNELANDKSLTIEKTGKNTISVSETFDDLPINISELNQKALENAIKFNIPNKVKYRDDYSNSFIFEEVAHFGYNSTVLTEYSKKVIQPVINFLQDNPGKKFTIRLYGHTDSKGTPQQNMVIANERVNEVKNYLVQQGVKANFITKSFGESRPATSIETPKTAIFNRRVQVRVYLD